MIESLLQNRVQASFGMIFFDFMLILLAYIILFSAFKRKEFSRNRINFVFIVITILSLFSFYDGDYFHYYTEIKDFSHSPIWDESGHIEQIYRYIAYFVGYNYILFRLCVWGLSYLLVKKISENLNISVPIFTCFFFTLFVLTFNYARVSLAMAIGFYGLSLLINKEKHTILSKLIGLSLIVASLYFHKSAFIIPVVALISLKEIDRRYLAIILCVFPLLVFLFSDYLLPYILSSSSGSNLFDVESAQYYLVNRGYENAWSGRNFLGKIHYLATYIPFILSFIFYLVIFFSGAIKKLPFNVKVFANASFWISLFASVFLFEFAADTFVLFYRFLFFAMIPGACMISYCYEHNIYSKMISYIYSIGTFCLFFNMAMHLKEVI